MKTTTKIIFGAALSMFSFTALSNQVWAAEITSLTSTGKIQITADGVANPKVSVDHMVNSVSLNFSINQDIVEGDYIEFSTHALPVFSNQDIFSDETRTVKIGELKNIATISGSRAFQNIGNPISSTDFSKLKPENQTQYRYKITFNEKVNGLRNIRFGIAMQNKSIGYSISNKEYQSRAWIKVAENEVTGADFTVRQWVKYGGSNSVFVFRPRLISRTGRMYVEFGYGVNENHEGGKVEYSFKDGAYYRFVDNNQLNRDVDKGSNFIYSDNSEVNQYGLIRSDDIGKLGYRLISQSDDKLVYDITSHKSNKFTSGITDVSFELTDEGKKYVAENGVLPNLEISARYLRKDGSVIVQWERVLGKVSVVGDSENFFSKILEEVKEIEEKQTPSTPQTQQPPKNEEIKAPDTGFSGGISALTLSSVALLATASALFFKKK